MVNLRLKRKLAARTLGVGTDRVWFDPEQLDELEGIDTREDIKVLVDRKIIKVLKRKGQSKREGRTKKGPGSRKGKKTARLSRKERWMLRVRAQRKTLRQLREESVISASQYRRLYGKVKGGMFRSKAHLNDYIKTHELKT